MDAPETELSVDSLNYEMKMCFWEEGKLNGAFAKL